MYQQETRQGGGGGTPTLARAQPIMKACEGGVRPENVMCVKGTSHHGAYMAHMAIPHSGRTAAAPEVVTNTKQQPGQPRCQL